VKKSASLLVSLLVACSAAQAQSDRWYTGVSVGQSTVKFDGLGVPGVSGSESKDETHAAYKVLAGYRVHRNFAVEAGYTNLSKVKDTISGPGGSVTITAEARGFHLDTVALLPRDQWDLFAKIGAMRSTTKTAFSTDAPVELPPDAKRMEWNFKWGLGAEYHFSRSLGWRAEYEMVKAVGDRETTGEGDVSMVSVGLVLRF
jgi:opacity protein-like surface antigen